MDIVQKCTYSKQVSWLRSADLAILTSGYFTYTADPRMRLDHTNYLDAPDFGLRINSIERKDAGTYECIINTRPESVQEFELIVNNGENSRLLFSV